MRDLERQYQAARDADNSSEALVLKARMMELEAELTLQPGVEALEIDAAGFVPRQG